MIKMIIKMDDDRIRSHAEYTLDKVYSALDRIFSQKGMKRTDTERGIEYKGLGSNSDFAHFGNIILGLKEKSWFMDNAATWLFCNSDDMDDPEDFSEEDLLMHYGKKAG